jgi:hypothetical protein
VKVKPLAAKYRFARNVQKGMEIQYEDGSWVKVTSALHVVGPFKVSMFGLADGARTSGRPDERVMCRRLHEADDDDE